MENIGQQHAVVSAAHLYLKRASGAHAKAIGHAKVLRVFLRHVQHVRPIQRHNFGVRILRRYCDSVHSMARGDVQYLAGFAFFGTKQRSNNCEDGPARGASPRAKATQNSSFGLVLSPPSDQTEPPLRTASVSEWKRARVWSLPKNPAIDATHAGDLRSRKNADSWVSAYFPSWSLIRNP